MTSLEKKQRILQFLEYNGRSSTSRIAQTIKSNILVAGSYLEDLKKEEKVIEEKETQGTYWCLSK